MDSPSTGVLVVDVAAPITTDAVFTPTTQDLLVDNVDKPAEFDLDSDFNVPEPDYEEKREQLKMGYWKSALFLVQGTIGISIFTLQKPLYMVGAVWGLILMCFTGYITGYGLIRLSNLASEVEKDSLARRKVKNFDELTRAIQGWHIPFVKILMMFAAVMMMFASTVSNILLVTTNVNQSLGWDPTLIKILVFVVIALVLTVVIEPEKIQYVNVYMTALLMGLAYVILGKNLYTWLSGEGPSFKDIPLWNMKNTGIFTGNVAYSFEVASNYLSLRLTSANDVVYSRLTTHMLIFTGVNFYLSAFSHLLAFPESSITENAFEMQAKTNSNLRILGYLFMVNTLYTFTFNTIFTCEIVETLPIISQALMGENGAFDRRKLIGLRIGLWGVAVLIAIFSTDVVRILDISGSLFTPIVDYFGPLILHYSYEYQKRATVSRNQKIHDIAYVLLALLVSFWGIYNAFY